MSNNIIIESGISGTDFVDGKRTVQIQFKIDEPVNRSEEELKKISEIIKKNFILCLEEIENLNTGREIQNGA